MRHERGRASACSYIAPVSRSRAHDALYIAYEQRDAARGRGHGLAIISRGLYRRASLFLPRKRDDAFAASRPARAILLSSLRADILMLQALMMQR